jgi:prevent-host-death family protein
MQITATELKQNTRKILDVAKDQVVFISRYGEPEAVLISYTEWEKMKADKDVSQYIMRDSASEKAPSTLKYNSTSRKMGLGTGKYTFDNSLFAPMTDTEADAFYNSENV